MPNKLLVTAGNWQTTKVSCTFAVTANGKALAAADPSQQLFDIPAGTTDVQVTATPTPAPNPYWPTTINLVVATTGSISPKADSSTRVTMTAATGTTSGVTQATVKMSRFRDVTTRVFDLLKTIPIPRGERAPPEAELKGTYLTWPPADWSVKPAPDAHFLDLNEPVKKGALNLVTDPSLKVEVESVVLELAGDKPPRLYGVTWPKAIAPKDGAAPTPILVFFRQTGGQDALFGVFTGGAVKTQPYPYNFDYAERCLFESLHYGKTPLAKAIGFSLRPKGVPYQVARSGAKVVTVFPVAAIPEEYGVLADMEKTGKILEELQAFMFWRAGVGTPPASLGRTAIAGFSEPRADQVAQGRGEPERELPQEHGQGDLLLRSADGLDQRCRHGGSGVGGRRGQRHAGSPVLQRKYGLAQDAAGIEATRSAVRPDLARQEAQRRRAPAPNLGEDVQGRSRNRRQGRMVGRASLHPGDHADARARAGGHLAGEHHGRMKKAR